MKIKDKIRFKTEWRVDKFKDPNNVIAEMLKSGLSIEEVKQLFPDSFIGSEVFKENVALNEGLQNLINIICGIGTTTLYNNANARLGVGDNSAAEAATQVMLQAIATKTAWAASTAKALGEIVRPTAAPTDASRFYYECTVAGTTGTTEPTWPTTDGATVVDNTVTWTARERIVFKAMDAGYPARVDQTSEWRSTYAGTDANFSWQEFTVDNGATAALNLNRRIADKGTKASGETWTLSLKITFS